MTNYELVLDDIIEKLEAAVMGCASFDADSVHFDYVRTEDFETSDPICLLSLRSDSVEAIGAKETQHTLTFGMRIKHIGTGTKANLSEIISYVSEIISKVEEDRTLGSDYIENTEVSGVEYSQEAPPNFVIYHAGLTIEVLAIRNA